VSDSRAAANLAVSSNVYYLPAPAPEPRAPSRPSRWRSLYRTWWRLRFAVAGLRLALRPAPTPLFAEDETRAFLDGRAEVVEPRSPRPRPARVIDFHTARARLR
jgi:hypothetical protein